MDEDSINNNLRVRNHRSFSVSEDGSGLVENKPKQKNSPSKGDPMISKCFHYPRDSLFTSSSGFRDYRGIVNWGLVLLILGGSRLVLENLLKYGILISPYEYFLAFYHQPLLFPFVLMFMYVNSHILSALYIEKWVVREVISSSVAHYLQMLNLLILVFFPPYVIWRIPPQPVATTSAMIMVTMVLLKLVSYKQVNSAHRDEFLNKQRQHVIKGRTMSCDEYADPVNKSFKLSEEDENDSSTIVVQYPYNLSIRNMYYFMYAPTLCYELNYPRTTRFDKGFLLRRVAEAAMLLSVVLALIQQWMIPVMLNSKQSFRTMNYPQMLERIMKLAVPNHLVWLLCFYMYFHSVLNAMAEVMGFADREFYLDWWNADNVADFWTKWNIPVHKFAKRHIYKPMLKRGFSRMHASLFVFLVSAFFHEYLVSVPLKMFRLWMFLGMLGQVPMAVLSARMSPRAGNMAMWLSLIIGQPAAALMYFHDYYVTSSEDAIGLSVLF